MLFPCTLVIKLLLSLGVLEEPSLVFLVFLEEVHTALGRELLEICAVAVVGSHQLEPGEGGTGRSTSTRGDMLLLHPSLLLLLPLSSRRVVIALRRSLKFRLSSLLTPSNPL